MSSKLVKPAGSPSALSAAFDDQCSSVLQALRGDVDRAGDRRLESANLAAIERTASQLRMTLQKVSRRRAGDLAERLDELDYPIAAVRAFFGRGKAALPKRATEIMAEYVRDRMLEIRVVAESLDAKSVRGGRPARARRARPKK